MQIGNCRWLRAPATILGPGSGFASSARNSSCRPSSLLLERSGGYAIGNCADDLLQARQSHCGCMFYSRILACGSRSAKCVLRVYQARRKSVGRLQDGRAGRNKNSLSGVLRRGASAGGDGGSADARVPTYRPASVRYASCRLKVQQRPLSLRECSALVPVKLFKLGQGADQGRSPVPLHQPCRQRPLRA